MTVPKLHQTHMWMHRHLHPLPPPQLRTYLEKVRPIDKQLHYQIEKLLRATAAAQAEGDAGQQAGPAVGGVPAGGERRCGCCLALLLPSATSTAFAATTVAVWAWLCPSCS